MIWIRLRGGHEAHCAGSASGSDGERSAPKSPDRYSYCAIPSDFMVTLCATSGVYAPQCDTTCGYAPIEQSGMATGAELAAYNYGDGQGNLNRPTDPATIISAPAYSAGSRTFVSSWGVAAPSNYYENGAQGIGEFTAMTTRQSCFLPAITATDHQQIPMAVHRSLPPGLPRTVPPPGPLRLKLPPIPLPLSEVVGQPTT